MGGAARGARSLFWWDGERAHLPGGRDTPGRAVAPCRGPPTADSSNGRRADMHVQSSQTHDLHRTVRQLRWQQLHFVQSHSRALSGWPFRRAARRQANGLRYGRSLPPPTQNDFRNSQGNSGPRYRVVVDEAPESPNAAGAGSVTRSRRMQRKTMRCKSDSRPHQKSRIRSRAVVAHSLRLPWPPDSRSLYSAPAFCGSNKSTPRAPKTGYWPNDVRTGVP